VRDGVTVADRGAAMVRAVEIEGRTSVYETPERVRV
jgi:hypothetical protein